MRRPAPLSVPLSLFVLLALTAGLACTPPPAPATVPAVAVPKATRLTPTAQAERVVLVSFDALSADALAAHKPAPGFEQLARDGAYARVIPVNPTATSSTHVSILTGADPQRHGVVANRFHLPGTPIDVTAHGLATEIDAETLVEAAKRQGRRVGAIPFPSVDARSGPRRADFGIVWPVAESGKVLRLHREDFHREWLPPTWSTPAPRKASFSPVMRARIDWVANDRLRADVDLVAYDTTDDHVENYDSWSVEIEGSELPRDRNGWFAVSRQGSDGLYGSWSKLLHAEPDLDTTLYWGPVSRTNAYPDSYRNMLDAEVGFWPSQPDERAELDPKTFEEQIVRLAEFLTRAQTLTVQRMEFDLLLAYQPEVDMAAHNFVGYDDGVVSRAFDLADHAVSSLRAQLDLTRDALVVTGDHGFAPIRREIRMNRLLADLGLGSRWRAYATGNVGHIYRFADPDDTAEVAAKLTQTGYFERIDVRQPGWHRNIGDLVAWGAPGTVLSSSEKAPVVGEPQSYGQHGALNTHREMHTALLAVGRGVPLGTFGDIAQTSIARFVSQLLGIQPPAAAQ